MMKKRKKWFLDKMLSEVGETCQQVLKMWQLSYSMEEISKEMSLSSPNMAKKKRFLCHKRLMLLIENKNYYSYLSESSMLTQTKAVVKKKYTIFEKHCMGDRFRRVPVRIVLFRGKSVSGKGSPVPARAKIWKNSRRRRARCGFPCMF